MFKVSKKLTTILIIVGCVSSTALFNAAKRNIHENSIADSLNRVKGQVDAPIKIIEYSDYRCSACAYGSNYIKDLTKEYPDLFRVEIKYYPLNINKYAALSARYVECAARQGKFWDFHYFLFENQKDWKNLSDSQSAFLLVAQELKLDLKELEVCVEDEEVLKFLEESKLTGKTLGVTRTPTYFINDKMVVGTVQLKQILEKLLENYKSKQASPKNRKDN